MRLFLIPVLLASATLPATAMAAGHDGVARAHFAREDRADRSADRSEHVARSSWADRTDRNAGVVARPDIVRQRGGTSAASPALEIQRPMRTERFTRPGRVMDAPGGFVRPDRAQQVRANGGQVERPHAVDQGRWVREQRSRAPRIVTADGVTADGVTTDAGSRNRFDRSRRGEMEVGTAATRGSFAQRLGRQRERDLAERTRLPGLSPREAWGGASPVRSVRLRDGGELRTSSSGSQWATRWRNDRRYDWQDWRRRNRSAFHIGVYYDPYGFGYRPLDYGWTLWPSYYRSNYWLNDPWQYRLPPAYGPYRWVRYWNDALLVDIYSGQVVDVIRDFFW